MGVVALAEAAVVVVLLTFSAKFVSNMGTLQMFVISGLMLAFNHMSPSLFDPTTMQPIPYLACPPRTSSAIISSDGRIPILSQQAQVIISPVPC